MLAIFFLVVMSPFNQLYLRFHCKIKLACRDIDEAWKGIKVLLVPSFWLEAWGIVVIKAQFRGIPVISPTHHSRKCADRRDNWV